MGSRQETWFYNSLSASADRGATWRIVGSQVSTYIHRFPITPTRTTDWLLCPKSSPA